MSCPDISLLTSISDTLGVTPGELLNGQRNQTISDDAAAAVDNALVYAEKSAKREIISFRNIWTISFSLLLLLGIIVCTICDMAISGGLTWSLYPISSILFSWLILIPIVKCGSKGIVGSLVSISIFIIPFLYLISIITSNSMIILTGSRISVLSAVYLWCVYFIFKALNTRKIKAMAFSLLLSIPLCLAINAVLSKYISEPLLDIWDIVSFGIITAGAAVLFALDYTRKMIKQ